MRRYTFTLVNTEMNLLNKFDEINKTISHLNSGGANKASYIGLIIELVTVSKNYIELDVDELNNKWHGEFGRYLKANHGMADYCNPDDESEMFSIA